MTLEYPVQDDVRSGVRLISWRMVAGLGCGASVQALLICWAVLGPWTAVEFSQVLGPSAVPGSLVGFGVAWSAVLAPLWFGGGEETDSRNQLYRSLFLGGWQGAALGFFLLVASRVAPLGLSESLQAVFVVTATTIFFVLLASKWEQAYLGIAFFLLAVLPTGAYLLSEVFVSTPAGALGFAETASPEAQILRPILNVMLSISPGTAATAALHGKLIGGMPWGWGHTALFAGANTILCTALGWSSFKNSTREN